MAALCNSTGGFLAENVVWSVKLFTSSVSGPCYKSRYYSKCIASLLYPRNNWNKTKATSKADIIRNVVCRTSSTLYFNRSPFTCFRNSRRRVSDTRTHVWSTKILSSDTTRSFCTGANSKEDIKPLQDFSPCEFVHFLKSKNISRFYIACDRETGNVNVSHPELEELGMLTSSIKDEIHFDNHEVMFIELGKRTSCLLSAFIWDTNRGQAFGGVRMLRYTSMKDYLQDGFRLSALIGIKAALAGLWTGGGKGVIAIPEGNDHIIPDFRQKILADYGDFVTHLNGCFVTGRGVGLHHNDILIMNQHTRYLVGTLPELGGLKLDRPSQYTAHGVICAMEAAVDFLNWGSLTNKSIAIQGAGHVGAGLIEELLAKDVKSIYLTECNQKRIDDVLDILGRKADGRLTIEKVLPDDNSIISHSCDILSPCAVGRIITQNNISKVGAKIVCGASNMPFDFKLDYQILADNDITYAVDYIANRMGVASCVIEPAGRLLCDLELEKHFSKSWGNSIFQMVQKVLQMSRDQKISPPEAARQLAKEMNQQLHPIYPGRTRDIISHILQSRWSEGMDDWDDKTTHYYHREGIL